MGIQRPWPQVVEGIIHNTNEKTAGKAQELIDLLIQAGAKDRPDTGDKN